VIEGKAAVRRQGGTAVPPFRPIGPQHRPRNGRYVRPIGKVGDNNYALDLRNPLADLTHSGQ
jgi:hypothetical protein